MSAPSFDVEAADRWFAVECNNEAWDLIERVDRDVAANDRLLRTAIASAWHWDRVGTDLHRLRAHVLLATAFVSLRRWDDGVRELAAARSLLSGSASAASGAGAFDHACIAGVHARLSRHRDETEDERRAAAAAFAAALERLDADDASVAEALYGANAS